MRLLLDDQLRVSGNACTELRGQRNGLIKAVGVQRLCAPKDSRHGLDGGSHHIVVGVLFGQGPTRSLGMGSEHQALGRLGSEILHDATPQQSGCAHLGNFQIKVHPHRPKEGQSACKIIDVQTLAQRKLHVLRPIGQGEGQLERLVGTRFLHVVARNRDGVEFGHLLRCVGNDVTNDAHRGLRRINVGVSNHELLQNIVLNGPG